MYQYYRSKGCWNGDVDTFRIVSSRTHDEVGSVMRPGIRRPNGSGNADQNHTTDASADYRLQGAERSS